MLIGASSTPTASPRVSVIVPATDDPSTLEQCTAAILAADDPPDELIVVQGPADSGPARARNAGALRATGSVLIFVDSDVVVHPDAFTRILALFERERDLAAVFGSYDDTPPAEGAVSSFRNLLHHHIHQRSEGAATTFWAGLGAIRREAFDESGGFDADLFPTPSIEDVELGLRLAAQGKRIHLDPRVQGTHLKTWSLAEMIRTDFRLRGVPWTLLVLRHGTHAARLNVGRPHRLSAAALSAALTLAALGRPRLAGYPSVLFLLLNRSFYALLLRRGGPSHVVAGVGLHAVHHLTAIASAITGGIDYLATRLEDREAQLDASAAGPVRPRAQ